MVELKSGEQLNKAIQRARENARNMIVRMTNTPRQYMVINKNNQSSYEVSFSVKRNGQKFASCDCKAGQHGLLCKHIAAAAALNTCLAEQGIIERRFVNSI
jgi:uncharacterized Zn finger protein